MSKKLVLLPLDERPCNYFFPQRLFSNEEIEIIKPDKLGNKKVPADYSEIKDFLLRECKNADGLVIAVDMLLYGGLIPSRLHNLSKEELVERAAVLKELKDKNPKLLIYAFNVIMRCPDYSSDDEEPDYYLFCGKEIHDLGVSIHKSRLGIENDNPVEKAMELVDREILDDYITRREINRYINVEILQLARDGYIDGLVIPQDDSAKYGYAAIDQEIIRGKISEYGMEDKVLVYPGADEVELTLIARMLNKLHQKSPKVYPKFLSEKARKIIPAYEGMPLEVTVERHIISAGCTVVENEEAADIVLIITAPSNNMREAVTQPILSDEYTRDRDLENLIDYIQKQKDDNKIVVVADNAYANGGDLSIINLMDESNMLLEVDGYAGWNTSANTIGTTLGESVFIYLYGKNHEYTTFLVSRYLEDAGYCGKIREEITDNLPDPELNYFDVKAEKGIVSSLVEDKLAEFLKEYLSSIEDRVLNISVSMPWKRMFEIDLKIECKEE